MKILWRLSIQYMKVNILEISDMGLSQILFELWLRKHYPNYEWTTGLVSIIGWIVLIVAIVWAIFSYQDYKIYLTLVLFTGMCEWYISRAKMYIINQYKKSL